MRQTRRFREENILNHQEFDTFQHFNGVARIGIAERMVVAEKIQAADLATAHGIMGFRELEPHFRRQLDTPRLLETASHSLIGHAEVAWQGIGQATHVTGPLHIVLPPERTDPGTRTAKISCQHGQVGDADHSRRPLGGFADPHPVQDGGCFGLCVHPGRFNQG